MSKKSISIQESVIEYFSEFDDSTVAKVTECVVFFKGTDDPVVSKISSDFINHCDMSDDFANYMMDLSPSPKNGNEHFRRSSMSGIQMVQDVRVAMLVMCFNRFYDKSTRDA